MRTEGFYFCHRFDGTCTIARWTGLAWLVTGDSHAFDDSHWRLIGKRVDTQEPGKTAAPQGREKDSARLEWALNFYAPERSNIDMDRARQAIDAAMLAAQVEDDPDAATGCADDAIAPEVVEAMRRHLTAQPELSGNPGELAEGETE